MKQIKYGFLIEDDKIFDTKIETYVLKRKKVGTNIIYYMVPKSYKRLYLFEPLLLAYPICTVFELLRFNSRLRKEREAKQQDSYLDNMANYSVVYNYPPLDLMPRQFELYKRCQNLKKRLD